MIYSITANCNSEEDLKLIVPVFAVRGSARVRTAQLDSLDRAVRGCKRRREECPRQSPWARSWPYDFKSRMNVGTTPAADEKPALPVESQLEQPCTLPR